MQFSSPISGFRLAFERSGSGPAVVLLHGWPGDHTDYDLLTARLRGAADVIVPDLRGFGRSDKHRADPEAAYSGRGQAEGVIGLIEELRIANAVLCGYDVGSFVAQTVATLRPDLVRALVVSPPLPGGGRRVLDLEAVREFWYTSFHRIELFDELVDGRPEAVRAYLRHFWMHWSGPGFELSDARLDHLTEVYSPLGAFSASVAWYRSSSNPVTAYAAETAAAPESRIAAPTTVLWQELDPIFPSAWSDRLHDHFSDVTLRALPGVGHFTPIEATELFAAAIVERLAASGPEPRL